MKCVETVRIELQYSRAGGILLGAMTFATGVVLMLTPLETALRMALQALVAAAGLEALQRLVRLRGPRAVRRFSLQRDGTIEVETPSGTRSEGRVRPGSFVAPWLVVVRWRRDGAWRDSTLLVLPGMAAAEDLRRLRVMLRWS